jgi:hypothetical protein
MFSFHETVETWVASLTEKDMEWPKRTAQDLIETLSENFDFQPKTRVKMPDFSKYSLIGLGGYVRSGKDTFADILVEEFDWVKDFMSRPLEEALLKLNPIIPVQFSIAPEFQTEQPFFIQYIPYKQYHSVVGYVESKNNPEVRRLLQALGTGVGRSMFGEDCWLNIIEDRIKYGQENEYKAVITGIRYHNELAVIKKLGGVSIWIDRGGAPVNEHSSDNTLNSDNFDFFVSNTGTIGDLRSFIRSAL